MGREDPPPPPPGSFSQCKKWDMPTIVSCAAQRYLFISASLLWDLKDQGFLRKWSILSKQPRVASDHAAVNMHLHVASSRPTKERERTWGEGEDRFPSAERIISTTCTDQWRGVEAAESPGKIALDIDVYR